MVAAATVLCLLLYIAAIAVISARLFHHQGPQPKTSLFCAVPAMLLHSFLIYDAVAVQAGQNLSINNIASIVAILIAITMTFASFLVAQTLLLPVVYGFSALVIILNSLTPNMYIMHIDLQPSLVVHIALALLAYGCLTIAFLYALQLNYIDNQLKQKHVKHLPLSLPPLMQVEAVLFKLLLVGTLLLTASLLSGFIFLENMFGSQQAHKTILSILAWLVYVGILTGHRFYGLRGKSVVVASVSGTLLLTLAYFGSRIVREIILQR